MELIVEAIEEIFIMALKNSICHIKE